MAATVEQIKTLEAAGCEIIRVAIPDQAAAEAVDKIKDTASAHNRLFFIEVMGRECGVHRFAHGDCDGGGGGCWCRKSRRT